MKFVDTHTHLYLQEFDIDLDPVIGRAIENGVERFLLPNIDIQTINPLINLCRQHPDTCYPMIGLHPTSVDQNFEKQLAHLHDFLDKEKFVAIGEIGIDLYWDKQYICQQIEAFHIQINWAKQYQLPIVIHCRKSFNEIMSVVRKEYDKTLTGVFHCFPGNIRQAEEITEFGFYLGIGGVVTYKNSEMSKVVEYVDLKHLVIETDSPFLPPVPYRGQRNESSYILNIAKKIAEIKNIPLNEVASIIFENTKKLFFNSKVDKY